MFEPRAAIIIAICAGVTMVLRFLPFLIFGGKRETPAYITYLGNVLPCAIMAMLVVYCLRNISFTGSTHGIPEIIACVLTSGLYVWKKNTLISIIGGTACYMILVNLVFA